jgi:hypothetical protein
MVALVEKFAGHSESDLVRCATSGVTRSVSKTARQVPHRRAEVGNMYSIQSSNRGTSYGPNL